jgi:ABC-type phosphate transport system substrate-binding protein
VRVTTSPRRHATAVIVAAAIALSALLLAVATVGGSATPDAADDANTPTADAVTQDSGDVNPWAAGSAAAQRYLAELGREYMRSGVDPPNPSQTGQHPAP